MYDQIYVISTYTTKLNSITIFTEIVVTSFKLRAHRLFITKCDNLGIHTFEIFTYDFQSIYNILCTIVDIISFIYFITVTATCTKISFTIFFIYTLFQWPFSFTSSFIFVPFLISGTLFTIKSAFAILRDMFN